MFTLAKRAVRIIKRIGKRSLGLPLTVICASRRLLAAEGCAHRCDIERIIIDRRDYVVARTPGGRLFADRVATVSVIAEWGLFRGFRGSI